MIEVLIAKGLATIPERKTKLSAGADIAVHFTEDEVVLEPMQRGRFPTGLFVNPEFTKSEEGKKSLLSIRSRSGLSYDKGIIVLNAPATIDIDYTGEVKILLINMSLENYTVKSGDRVAQIFLETRNDVFPAKDVERGEGGFGSTGTGE